LEFFPFISVITDLKTIKFLTQFLIENRLNIGKRKCSPIYITKVELLIHHIF